MEIAKHFRSLDNYRKYYNFSRKHQGFNGKTQLEMTGIIVKGDERRKTINTINEKEITLII